MPKPYLIIVAGCNGAGKSTFSKTYVEDGFIPFDTDKRFLENYRSLQNIDIGDTMAHNMTTKEFESSIEGAFSNGENFCYETNFNIHPVYWAEKAKSHGYHLELHFFCLNSRVLAQSRVALRAKNNGHFVDRDTVIDRWKEGYKNLNLHFGLFDRVLLIDNSSAKKQPKNLFSLIKKENGKYDVEIYTWYIPKYARRRYPEIYKIIRKSSLKGRLLPCL